MICLFPPTPALKPNTQRCFHDHRGLFKTKPNSSFQHFRLGIGGREREDEATCLKTWAHLLKKKKLFQKKKRHFKIGKIKCSKFPPELV